MGLTKPRAAQIYNLDYKQSTRVVTVTDINLSGGAPSSIDGVNLSLHDRILVIGQGTASQNGLYYVTTVGSGSNGTWVRTSDGNETGEIESGMIVMVTEGAIYADTQWKLITDDPITIGSTALIFTQNYSANSIAGGSSNVTVFSNANVTVSSAGTPNVLIVSSTGTVTSGTASITGNVTGGNILTNGRISATGNITGNYFLGNVFYASGITASKIYSGTSEVNVVSGGGNVNVSVGGTSNVVVWASTGEYVNGLLSVTGNINGANLTVSGDIMPTANNLYALGSPTMVFQHLYVGPNSMYIGGSPLSTTDGSLLFNGEPIVTANTDGTSTTYGNMVIVGNITGSNILTSGQLSATGNIAGSYLLANIAFATGYTASKIYNGTSEANIGASGGNANISIGGTSNVVVIAATGEYVTGVVSATSNIVGGNIVAVTALTNGNITITGANIVSADPTIYIDPNGAGGIDGNVIIAGNLSVQGNVTYINSNSFTASGQLLLTQAGNLSTGAGQLYLNGATNNRIDFNTNGTQSPTFTTRSLGTKIVLYPNLSSVAADYALGIEAGYLWAGVPDSTNGFKWYGGTTEVGSLTGAGILSVAGNITGGNIRGSGNITTPANLSVGGNIIVTSSVTANGSIVANSNLFANAIVSAAGNVVGANMTTSGNVSATGNVTGGNILGNGSNLTGILAFKTIAVDGGTQSNIVANSIASTLTFGAGTGLVWTSDPDTGILTISTTSSGTSIFADGGDMGFVTEVVTASEDLGSVVDAATIFYDLGSVVSASGLIYPSQLILPTYIPGTLPPASPAAQFVYLSTSSIGPMTAFSDGTDWRFTSTGAIVS